MCPVCLTTVALIAAGTGATAGLAGLVLARRRPAPTPLPEPDEKGAVKKGG